VKRRLRWKFGKGQMTGKAYAIAYWLLPEAATREVFLREIRRLARQFGAPLFEPHVTIFVAPENSRAPLEVLREVGSVDVELAIHSIRFSEQFTKTLFVQFERNSALQQLGDAIWKAERARNRYLIDPHLSLLYSKLPSKTNQRLADNIRLPFRKVGFTSICVMQCASPTTRAIEVEQWKLLAP
jgi:2'-5' RNA ligase